MTLRKPPTWAYEPRATRRERERATLRQIGQQITPLAAKGDPASLDQARSIISQQQRNQRLRETRQNIAAQVRQNITGQREPAGVKPKKETPKPSKKKRLGGAFSAITGAAGDIAEGAVDVAGDVGGAIKRKAVSDVRNLGSDAETVGKVGLRVLDPFQDFTETAQGGLGLAFGDVENGELGFSKKSVGRGLLATGKELLTLGKGDAFQRDEKIRALGREPETNLWGQIKQLEDIGEKDFHGSTRIPTAVKVGSSIALDPLMYVPIGAVGRIAKMPRGAAVMRRFPTAQKVLTSPRSPVGALLEGPSRKVLPGMIAGSAGAAELVDRTDIPGVPENVEQIGARLLGGVLGGAVTARLSARGGKVTAPTQNVIFGKGRIPGDQRRVIPDSLSYGADNTVAGFRLKPGDEIALSDKLTLRRQTGGNYELADANSVTSIGAAEDLSSLIGTGGSGRAPQPLAGERLWFHSTNDKKFDLPDPDKAVGQSTGVTQGPGIYMAADPEKSVRRYGDRTFVSEFDGDVLDLTAPADGALWARVRAEIDTKLQRAGLSPLERFEHVDPDSGRGRSRAELGTAENNYGYRDQLANDVQETLRLSRNSQTDPTPEGFIDLAGRFSGAANSSDETLALGIVNNVLADNGVDALFHHSPSHDGDVLIVLKGEKARVVADVTGSPEVVTAGKTLSDILSKGRAQRNTIRAAEARQLLRHENGDYTYRTIDGQVSTAIKRRPDGQYEVGSNLALGTFATPEEARDALNAFHVSHNRSTTVRTFGRHLPPEVEGGRLPPEAAAQIGGAGPQAVPLRDLDDGTVVRLKSGRTGVVRTNDAGKKIVQLQRGGSAAPSEVFPDPVQPGPVATPAAAAGAPPPPKPPPAAQGLPFDEEPPRSPLPGVEAELRRPDIEDPARASGYQMGERGTSALETAIARSEEALLKQGPIGQRIYRYKGARKFASVVNPSVDQERAITVAYHARTAEKAALQTQFAVTRNGVARQLDEAFQEMPAYRGPEPNPIKNTILDIAENPRDYDLSPRQTAALRVLEERNLAILRQVREQYNVRVLPFKLQNGGFYLPHVNAADDLDLRVQRTVDALSEARSQKQRLWETARERAISDPKFVPETDVRELLASHDNGLANSAGNEVFKLGAGGKTKLQVMDEVHPELVQARDAVRQRITNARGRLETALRQSAESKRTRARTETQLRAVQRKMGPLQDRVRDLGDEYGPELSHLSGQVYELRLLEARLGKVAAKQGATQGEKLAKGANLAKLIDDTQASLDRLITQYKGADTGDYVLDRNTFRFYTPEAAKSVSDILQVKHGTGLVDTAMKVADEARATVLAGDLSPLTLQYFLGWLLDPITATRTLFAQIGENPKAALLRIAKEQPDDVAEYVRSTGRPFGEIATEFSIQRKGLGRIPRVAKAEDWMFAAVQRQQFEQWKNDRALIQGWKRGLGVSETEASTEAANALSKTVPMLNPAETGTSRLANRERRALFTSPSYLAAPAIMVKDASSGIAKLVFSNAASPQARWAALSGREQLAILRGTWMAGSLTSIAVLSAMASADSRNMSVEDAVAEALDPKSKYFWAIQFGGGRSVSIGGPMRSFGRMLAETARDPKNADETLARFLTSKLSPFPGTALDLARNKDFFGNRIYTNFAEALWYAAENVALPISLGSISEGVRTGVTDPVELLTEGAGQFLGQNVAVASPLERLDQVSRQRFGKEFWDLEANEREAIKKQEGNLWDRYVSRSNDERQRAEELKATFGRQQVASDDQLLAGELTREEWLDQYRSRRDELRVRQAEIYGERGSRKDKTPMDRYIRAIDDATDPETGAVDWDQVDEWRSQQTPEDTAYIERNTGLTGSPLAQLYREVSSRYYELPRYRGYTADEAAEIDAVWQEARNRARSTDRAHMLAALRRVSTGVSPRVLAGVRRRILGMLRELDVRERWRASNPASALIAGRGTLTERERSAIEASLRRREAA